MIERPNPILRPPWRPAACAAAVALLLYAHTLAGTFIYDDLFHALNDPRLADVGRWGEYWTQGYFPDGADHLWRPLVSMSYAVQAKISGAAAWPFHLVNVLMHAGVSALVAELARRLTGSGRVATIAGVLFAAHPVHVEGVAYIVGRAESMCAAGVLGALVLACRPLTRARAVAIFACAAAAVLSKEQGLLTPAMVMALWWIRRSRDGSTDERSAATLLLLIFLSALPAYVLYREHILPWGWDVANLDWATQPMVRSGAADQALIPVALFGRAVALIVWPARLSPEYGLAVITPVQSWADPYLYVGTTAMVAFVGFAIIAVRRRAWVVIFLLLGAALTYGMVANVVLIGVVFAERLLYLPSAFVLILAAIALAQLPRRTRTVVVAAVVVLLGWRTVTYAARWNDRLGFYDWSVIENPRSVRLRVLLEDELMKLGRWDEASRANEAARAIAPDYWKVWADAARVSVARGQLSDATASLERAWSLRGNPGELLGVQADVNRLREAIDRNAIAPQKR